MQQVTLGALKNTTSEDLARLSTLSVVSKHLCGDHATESLIEIVLETLVQAFQADRGFVVLEQEVRREWFLDLTREQKYEAFDFTDTLVESCLEQRLPVLMLDAESVAPTESIQINGIRSVMLAPLVARDRVLGVVYLDSLIKAGCFQENDLSLLGLIAEMVSIAVERNLHADVVAEQSLALTEAEEQLERAAEETIQRLSLAAEYRDGETSLHLTRVAEYSEALAQAIGLDEQLVKNIKIASLLHDVGKLGIPDSVLLKPGRFTDYERKVMQQHTIFGAKILADSSNPVVCLAAEIALSHHEKWDGSGYPDGISGEEIPVPARIVAVADVFDAVTSARRYKESYSLEDSFQLLQREAGSHFDPKLIEAFLAIKDRVVEIHEEHQDQPKSMESMALPAVMSAGPVAKRQPDDSDQELGVSILVVDSDPYQREVLSTEATRRSMSVRECSTPDRARKAMRRRTFSLVILELADPGAQDFLTEIRREHEDLPLIILSRDGELTRRLSVSKDKHCSYLHKPVPPAAVLDEAEECLPQTGKSRPRTVLALDDDPVVLKVMDNVLSRNGYRVYTVGDPLDFWEFLTEHTPDLILLDLEMPSVTGYEICQVLRNDAKYRHLPVVVLTGHSEIEEYQRALEAGADDVLSKPLQPTRLVSRIESRLSRNQALQLSAARDPLTGLVHQRQALQSGERLFSSCLRRGAPFSVCRVEIEAFQQLVDQDGWQHALGCLREVAEVLVRNSRPEDVVTRWKDYTLLLLLGDVNKPSAENRISSLNSKLAQTQGALAALRCKGTIVSSPYHGSDLKKLLSLI